MVIVNYNTKKLTLDCINSIIKEGSQITTEIIVIDNDSRDGSVPALRKLEKEHKNLKLVGNKDNLGFSKACNRGIKMAKASKIGT